MIKDDFSLLTGTSNLDLAEKIGKILNKKIHQTVSRFADGEARITIPDVRKKQVFIIQSTCPPVDRSLIELLLIIDAAKRGSASEVTAVIPYFGYSRQDRIEKPGAPVSAFLVSNLIEYSGASRIVTIDIHTKAIQDFVKIPWDDLSASSALMPVLKSRFKDTKNLVIVSPDKGGVLRANVYAKLLRAGSVAIIYKKRDIQRENISKALRIVGDVSGKEVLIIDDIVDTGGTLLGAIEILQKNGAKSITAAVTHGIFSESAIEKIQKSNLKEIFVTDSVPQKTNGKIKVVSIAKLLADEISGSAGEL